jgi:sec-independent protein translocase protein TatB
VFNVTGGELVIILLVALIVLGPDKLPDAIRKVGRVYAELRRMSQGFQSEIREALDEPMREVRDTMNTMKGGFLDNSDEPGPANPADPPAGTRLTAETNGSPGTSDGTGAEVEPPPAEPEPAVAVADPEPPPPIVETPDELAALPAEPSPPSNGASAGRDEHEPAPAGSVPENEHS